ncbi:MAG: metal ABC transporter permease [Kiritimatiellae bacterium]|nr:metal ABC transporter permease [Kiritimatiellia bacterium]
MDLPAFFNDLRLYRFLQYAVLAGLLAALPAGVVGCWVVVRRTTYLAGAISHCVLAGVGLAIFLQRAHGVAWMSPALGALLAAVGAALLVGFVTLRGRHRADSVLSAVWAVGMALGVSFMAVTPGYQTDLMSYLFGNILMVTPRELILMAVLDVLVVGLVTLCYNRFLAIGFSVEIARLRGVRVVAHELLFMVLTAVTIFLLVKVVGIVLALALLTLPAATAGLLTSRLDRMILLAVLFGMAVTLGGLFVSYAPGWPAGATIVELAALVYVTVALATGGWRHRHT